MSKHLAIRNEIARFLAENYDLALDALDPQATLEEVGVDSLGMLGIATLLENKFGLRFEAETMVDMRTFADLMNLVQAKVAQLG